MRPADLRIVVLCTFTLLAGALVFAADAKPQKAPAQGAEIHYWSGQTRVDLVLALDELQIEYLADAPDADALKAGVPGFEKIETVNTGKKQSRVQFKKVANPKALNAQANAVRKLKNVRAAAAVAFQPQDEKRSSFTTSSRQTRLSSG